jgi:hypothetical protein
VDTVECIDFKNVMYESEVVEFEATQGFVVVSWHDNVAVID